MEEKKGSGAMRPCTAADQVGREGKEGETDEKVMGGSTTKKAKTVSEGWRPC